MKGFFMGMCLAALAPTISFAQQVPQAKPDSASQEPYENKDNRYYQRDMVQTKPADLPAAIMQALKKPEYKGWESGTMYRSSDGQTYLLELDNGKRIYRFDQTGKSIKQD